jgi:hypothetical protein
MISRMLRSTCALALTIGPFTAACSGASAGIGGTDAATDTAPGDDASAVDGPAADASDAGPKPAHFRVSLSPSPFAELLFTHGASMSDGTHTASDLGSLADLFASHGATEIYARISTRKTQLPGGGPPDPSMVTGLARAQLASARGVPFNPELSLFRSYGDVSCQTPPDLSEWGIPLAGPWETLGVDAMATALRAYTAAAAGAILATGVRVEVWDIGNEVDFGTAGVAPAPLGGAFNGCDAAEGASGWYRPPNAVDPAIGMQSVGTLLAMDEATRIAWLRAHLWPYEAKLLAAAAAGIRSVVPGALVETHISNSSSATFAVAFYQAMKDGGLALDAAGFSFYPSSAGSPTSRLHDLAIAVQAVHDQFGLTSFIAECGYPATPMSGTSYFSTWNNALPNYPITEAGQHDVFRDLASWGASGALTGIRPWAPELYVSDWAPMSFFALPDGSVRGEGRSSIDAIAQGAASPDPNALKY